MEKTYVLDTSVLLQTPYALEAFEDNQIVLPIAVLEELDALKGAEGEQGTNARQAIRRLEALRAQGNLLSGVPLPNGGWLRVETNCVDVPLPTEFPGYPNHRRILQVCQALRASQSRVVLVTKNILLRIKAQILGLPAEDFTSEQAPVSADQYTGRCQVFVSEKKFEAFPKKAIDPEDVYQTNELGERKPVDLVCNQFVILRADQSSKKTQLGRFDGKKIVPLAYKKKKPYGISPRNVGQYFLQEALMTGAEEAPLVIVKGMAGTAKTFYSLAVGLHALLETETPAYRRILISRPNVHFDDDIGFLPGDEGEKIAPLLRPVIDNLELLVDQNEDERFADERSLSGKIEELFARDQRPGAELHPGPVGDQNLPHHRRGPEPHPQAGQGHHHPGGDGHQDHPPGGPQPDRQPPPGRAHQRPELRRRDHEGKPPVLPGHPLRRGVRAVGPGHRRGAADVTAPLRLKSIIPLALPGGLY